MTVQPAFEQRRGVFGGDTVRQREKNDFSLLRQNFGVRLAEMNRF